MAEQSNGRDLSALSKIPSPKLRELWEQADTANGYAGGFTQGQIAQELESRKKVVEPVQEDLSGAYTIGGKTVHPIDTSRGMRDQGKRGYDRSRSKK